MKRVIIKDVDFSENAINETQYIYTWYIDVYSEQFANKLASQSFGYFVPGNYANVQGKTINCIQLKVGAEGTFTIAVADSVNSSANFSQLRTFVFTPNDVDHVIIKTFDPIVVPLNGYISLCSTTDTGNWYFSEKRNGSVGYYVKVGQNGGDGKITMVSVNDLNINFGIAIPV